MDNRYTAVPLAGVPAAGRRGSVLPLGKIPVGVGEEVIMPKTLMVQLCGAAMDGRVRIPEKQYGKNITIDYHIGEDLYRCIFEMRKPGKYFLIALQPYAKAVTQ